MVICATASAIISQAIVSELIILGVVGIAVIALQVGLWRYYINEKFSQLADRITPQEVQFVIYSIIRDPACRAASGSFLRLRKKCCSNKWKK